jgi:hypothetical protein
MGNAIDEKEILEKNKTSINLIRSRTAVGKTSKTEAYLDFMEKNMAAEPL